MTRPDPVREAVQRLSEAAIDPALKGAQADIKAALKSKVNLVVARAAKIAGAAMMADLVPDLEEAYSRFLTDAVKSDKACLAKTAVVEAIGKIGSGGDQTLRRAVRWHQPEPAYGEPIDTATSMSATACVALAERRHPLALDAAATLLADAEPSSRLGALKALETLPSEGAKVLLKFKLLIRDREPEVVAENLRALLTVKPDEIALGQELLTDEDARLASMAALAVGESRADGAYEALAEAYERRLDAEFRNNVLVALGLLRDERCVALLCEAIRGADREKAIRALDAGLTFAADAEFRSQLEDAVNSVRDRALRAAFEERYGPAAVPSRR